MGDMADYYIDQMMDCHESWGSPYPYSHSRIRSNRVLSHEDMVNFAKRKEADYNQQERVMRDMSLASVLKRVKENSND